MPPINSNVEPAAPYRWHTGGWFGGIVGSTLGLPSYAVAIREHHPTRALLLFGMFAVAPVLATSLWLFRGRISARRALFVALPIVVLIDVIGFMIILPLLPLSEHDALTKFQSLNWRLPWNHWVRVLGFWLALYLLSRWQRRSRRT